MGKDCEWLINVTKTERKARGVCKDCEWLINVTETERKVRGVGI